MAAEQRSETAESEFFRWLQNNGQKQLGASFSGGCRTTVRNSWERVFQVAAEQRSETAGSEFCRYLQNNGQRQLGASFSGGCRTTVRNS